MFELEESLFLMHFLIQPFLPVVLPLRRFWLLFPSWYCTHNTARKTNRQIHLLPNKNGKTLLSQKSNSCSVPRCFCTVVKKKNECMLRSGKHHPVTTSEKYCCHQIQNRLILFLKWYIFSV